MIPQHTALRYRRPCSLKGPTLTPEATPLYNDTIRYNEMLDHMNDHPGRRTGKTTNSVLCSLFLVVCALVLTGGWCRAEEIALRKTPSISEIVLVGLRPAREVNPLHYPKECRRCLRNYLAAIAPDSYLWSFEPPSTVEATVRVRRVVMTEQMVTILGRQARAEAEAFADAIPLMSEWEGMSEGPIGEADFADNWLRKRPMTPLAPFLHLLKAHRLRSGYEAARARNEKGLWPILAKRYREALNMAKSSSNPLISCIADDLEAQPFVYLEGQGKP